MIAKQHDASTTSCHHCQMNKLEITVIHSGKEFCTNGIRLRVQFLSFVFNPQHFINQTLH